MRVDELPVGPFPKALEFEHFPTRQQAFVWRNWELAPAEKLAAILKTSAENVREMAFDMGLPPVPDVSPLWRERGYMTLIRNNWHLLPYSQLLELLEWTPEEMAYALKEDDFLFGKLGQLKPDAEPLVYRSLTPAEKAATEKTRGLIEKHFPDFAKKTYRPFAFLEDFNGAKSRKEVKKPTGDALRLIYSYSAVYGDPLARPELDPYPEGLLEKYAEIGVNAVWLQGVLYSLVPWDRAPEMAEGYATRLRNLRELTEKAAKRGISVYLYMNEPRVIPAALTEKFKDLKGVVHAMGMGLCSASPEVLGYLKNAMTRLFREVPKLGGAFTITRSENPTNCHSHNRGGECPRCKDLSPADAVSAVNNALAEGVAAAGTGGQVIAWTWGWEDAWAGDAIDKLRPDVAVMCEPERELATESGGVKGLVSDYTISKPGIGPYALGWWKRAKARGLKILAKVQLNNTWELSAVPFLPTIDLVEERLGRLRELGVDGLMMSWTLGGYPTLNLELANASPETLAKRYYGDAAAPIVREAWRRFSAAFAEFPLNRTATLYRAPQNYGPMNLLYAAPTGYKSTMVGFPYDDLDGWRGIFPPEIFEDQFRKIRDGWEEGLRILETARERVPTERMANYRELETVSLAAFCHFQSAYDQIRFVRCRETDSGERNAILDREIQTAKTLFDLVHRDSRIGFEASNHYYYTRADLMEKVLNCERLRQGLV